MSIAAVPSVKDAEAYAINAPIVTGTTAVTTAALDTETFLPHDPQSTWWRGPILSFCQAVIAGWRQYGQLTIG